MNQDGNAQPRPEDFGDIGAPAPGWPKVIGIISIVWGSIGALCTVLGPAANLVFRPMMESAADGGPLPPTATFTPAQWALAIVGLITTIVLIAAGAATAARKAKGRTLHLVYGVVSLVQIVVSVFFAINQVKAMSAWVEDNPDSPFAAQHNETAALLITFVLLAVFAVWPLFCVVWFGMLNKRPEEDAPEITA